MGLLGRLQAGPVEFISLQNGNIIVTHRIQADSCQTCHGNAIDEDIPLNNSMLDLVRYPVEYRAVRCGRQNACNRKLAAVLAALPCISFQSREKDDDLKFATRTGHFSYQGQVW
jgi:hypothetical protein